MSSMSSSSPNPRITPLPKFQLALVLLIQSSEAITATVIYPFIAQLIRTTGITGGDETKVGYYAGVLESIFFLAEASLVYFWGYASDKYGRRPVLVVGPLGLAVAMAGFGLSRSFWVMVVFRAIQGVFNGNVAVARTVTGELADETNVADAYRFYPIVWECGVTLGPSIGGIFAEPAKTWPKVFGKLQLFVERPYFLPCLLAGMFPLVAFVLSFVALKETHASYRKTPPEDSAPENDARTPLLSSSEPGEGYDSTTTISSTSASPSPIPTSEGIWNPSIKIVTVNYCFLAFTDLSYNVLIPIFYATPNSLGGLEFPTRTIGILLASFAFTNALIQFGPMKWATRALGPRRTYQLAYGCLTIPFVMMMCEQMLVDWYGRVVPITWVVIVLQLAGGIAIATAYTSMHVLLFNAATPGTLGATNAITQVITSGLRAVAPSFTSSLFAWSLQSQIAGGYLVYIVLITITVVGTLCTRSIPKNLA